MKTNKKSTQRVQRKYYYRTIIALIILYCKRWKKWRLSV
nr:MAG TPA: hypothetical protein [Caudoviricetes sp.]